MNPLYKKYAVIFIIAFTLLTNLGLGLARLGEYSSVDEPYWTYGRITKFWNGIKAHKWKTTSVNDKPGITVALISGAGLTRIDPMPYRDLRGDPKTEEQLRDINTINVAFRLPIFLFSVLLLPLFYVLLRKLFDETTALLGYLFISLSPILLGISLIINPDSLLWIFLPLSILSLLVYYKHGAKRYLLLGSVLLGLSLLTKYVANILYIFFFFLPFLEYAFLKEKPELRTYLKKAALDYGILALLSMAVFFLLYPATWVNPKLLLEGTFFSKAFQTTWPLFVGLIAALALDNFILRGKLLTWGLTVLTRHRTILMRLVTGVFLLAILFVFYNTYTHMSVLDTAGTLASPKGVGEGSRLPIYADRFVADIFSLIFAISPLALFALMSALVFTLKKDWIETYEAKIVFYLSSFILFYYLASTVNNVVATVRYQIALYPLAFVMAAIGLAHLCSQEKISAYSRSFIVPLLVFFISLFALLSVKPFYFAYASSLLPERYFVNLKDMGDGSYEAAQFLNNLPQAEALTIWSDKGAVCAVFKGKCIIGFTDKRVKGVNFDYVVVSSGRRSRTLKMSGGAHTPIDFKAAYASEDTAFKVTIGGRPNNYVKVFSLSAITKKQ
ncbi:MAG: glycosyltransferase family 39 protein [Candidatus Moranbacteria bacterium]|nr:glycosyltransferase family 39 protein [Candidatus Moranbacteria bacterium]